MTTSLQEEACKIVYINEQPEFLVRSGGMLKFYRLTPADHEDLQIMFQAKKVELKSDVV